MNYKGLFIFIEGEDDQRFFKEIIEPKILKKYNYVKMITYANMKKEKIKNFLKSIKEIEADYIYVTDINNSPCVTAKKEEIQNKLKNIEKEKIIVVIKEIESWYLAGLDSKSAKKLGVGVFKDTNTITKEEFNDSIPKKFSSRVDFLIEILKVFSIDVAKQKNNSFRYFIEKWNC